MQQDETLHVGQPNIGDRSEFFRRVSDILDRKWVTNNGPVVHSLERSIASLLGVRNCVAMCNGTIALEIAIRALGLSGEVIVPSWTFIATAHALHWQDITPVFADIDPLTHNLDPRSVSRMITPRTSGIIGVHLWGRPAPVYALQSIADDHGLDLLFDAAHAFRCTFQGTAIGAFGRCEVLSFHATKVFNTFEGGAIVTNDDELAEKARLMRNFGFSGLDNVVHPGTNGKMTEVCAAMGLVNLDCMSHFVEANRRAHLEYGRAIAGVDGIALLQYDDSEANNWQYVVLELDEELASRRDQVISHMHTHQVRARKYFWPGCHRMQPYRSLYPNAGVFLPQTERLSERIIVLPTGMGLPESGVDRVVGALVAGLGARA